MLTFPITLYAADILASGAYVALENAKYTGKSYTTGLSNPQGIRFYGTNKFYVLDSNSDSIREFTYTPGDITTAVQTYNLSIAGQETTSVGLDLNPDGSQIFVYGVDSDSVWVWPLGTAGDLSSAGAPSSFNVGATNYGEMYFSRDGLNLYFTEATADLIHRRQLGTAWDISTIGVATEALEYGTQEFNADAMFMKEDAGQCFVLGRNSGAVNNDGGDLFGYNLPAQDGTIDNGEYSGHFTDVSRLNAECRALCFTDDYSKAYFAGIGTNVGVVYELDVPVIPQFDVVNPYDALGLEYEGEADFSATIGVNSMFSAILSPDGTKGIALHRKNPDELLEFDCSTAYDLSTATLNGNSVTLSSIGAPNFSNNAIDLFSIDGNILYVTVPSSGAATQGVYQYNFNTPYDVTDTITYVGFSGSIGNVPFSACYNPAGTKLYLGNGGGSTAINQYSLNVANDLSGGIVSDGIYSDPVIGAIRNVRFNNDGTRAYLGNSNAKIFQVKLDTPYDFTGTVTIENESNIPNINGLYQFEMYDSGQKSYAVSAAPQMKQYTPKYTDPFTSLLGSPDQISTTYSPISAGTNYTLGQNGGRSVQLVQAELVCLVANNGYSVGDTVPYHAPYFDVNAGSLRYQGCITYSNDTDIGVTIAQNYIRISAKTGGGNVDVLGTANWGLRLKAWNKIPCIYSDNFTLANNTKFTLSHPLGAGIYLPMLELQCINAEDGWANGDKITIMSKAYNSGNTNPVVRGYQVGYNASEAWALIGDALSFLNKSTGGAGTIDPTRWRMKVKLLKLKTPDFTSSGLGPPADNGSFSAAHSLTNIGFAMTEWVCISADDNWAVGDRMPLNYAGWDTANVGANQMRGFTGGYNSTDIFYACSINSNILLDKNSPNSAVGHIMNAANWELRLSGWEI